MLVKNKSFNTKNVKFFGVENNFDDLIDTVDIYVFGSNDFGHHHSSGAQWVYENDMVEMNGDFEGLSKSKRAYAIITKIKNLDAKKSEIEMLEFIQKQTEKFIDFALKNKTLNFKVLPFGISRVNFDVNEIVKPFIEKQIPKNIKLPKVFLDSIESRKSKKD